MAVVFEAAKLHCRLVVFRRVRAALKHITPALAFARMYELQVQVVELEIYPLHSIFPIWKGAGGVSGGVPTPPACTASGVG